MVAYKGAKLTKKPCNLSRRFTILIESRKMRSEGKPRPNRVAVARIALTIKEVIL